MKTYYIETPSSAGVTIHNRLHSQESDLLLVLLPGVGYLVSHTILHLMSILGLNLGYDVLQIPYGFQVAQDDFELDQIPLIRKECQQTLSEALERGYQSVVLVGKSLGTLLAASLSQEFSQIEKLILLTPVMDSTSMTGSIPTLALIGTADNAYNPDNVQNSATLNWRVFEGLDHGLMVPGDVQASLKVLPDVVQACEDFLRK
ncbi:MAG: hypothetical protein KC496_04445 [Anaerolineae bacterium]|nr:hypothetical protein [Anaerolineae bacterium]